MTDTEMRVAIAEKCGWTFRQEMHLEGYPIIKSLSPNGLEHKYLQELPDYPNDLNAMHAAEAGMVGHEMIAYQHHLSSITEKNPHVSCWDLIHATARQRAEALCRTLGIWKE